MKVVWMYHDIMDLYGDKGNMMVLMKRCLDRGIPFELDTCGIGEEKDLSEYDLIFLGGGADKEQISLIPDLLSRKENIKKAIDEKTFVLLICGGYQLIDANLDGLKTRIVGFENHGGQTLNVMHPLGKVVKGCGNSFNAGYEGFYDGKILGTYLHGPLLPKNPEVADFVKRWLVRLYLRN